MAQGVKDADAERRSAMLEQWLSIRGKDDQYEAFARFCRLFPDSRTKSWIGALDAGMRAFASAELPPLPPDAVAGMLDEIRVMREQLRSLNGYLPWLMLVDRQAPGDLRIAQALLEASAAPGLARDPELAKSVAAKRILDGCDDKTAAGRQRLQQLVEWLPELRGFGDPTAAVEWYRAETKATIARLVAGESIEPAALLRAAMQRLDARFVAALADRNGDPFAVVAQMRELSAADPTPDLLYFLLARSSGRTGEQWRECAKRFATACANLGDGGAVDLGFLRSRMSATGVSQACADLGLTWSRPEQLLAFEREQLQGVFPSFGWLNTQRSGLETDCRQAENKITSCESAIKTSEQRARQAREAARRHRSRGGNENQRRHNENEARTCEARAEAAEGTVRYNRSELAKAKERLAELEQQLARATVRLERMYGK